MNDDGCGYSAHSRNAHRGNVGDDTPGAVARRPGFREAGVAGWAEGREVLAGVWVTAEYMDIIIVKVST